MPATSADSRPRRPGPDPLGRFYTAPGIADALAALMPARPGGRLLDLASGGGALSLAAAAAFRPALAVSVDLDPGCAAPALPGVFVRHVRADATDPGLPALLSEAPFDAVVSNPPYVPAPPDPRHALTFSEAGLDWAWPDGPPGADAIVAAQCLRLCRPGGVVGLVLPDGLVSGRRAERFRRALLSAHRVLHVAQLTPRAFGGTEARAHLVVVERGAGPSPSVPVSRLGPCGDPILVAPVPAAVRLDHAHHAARPSGPTLAGLGAALARGSLEAVEAVALDAPLFRTRDFPRGQSRRAHALPDWHGQAPGRPLVVARPGDILLARIGRGLHANVCGVDSGAAVPTAAVLRLRVPEARRDAVLSALLSPEGEARLAATARGTGTRMIGQADLMAMPLPL